MPADTYFLCFRLKSLCHFSDNFLSLMFCRRALPPKQNHIVLFQIIRRNNVHGVLVIFQEWVHTHSVNRCRVKTVFLNDLFRTAHQVTPHFLQLRESYSGHFQPSACQYYIFQATHLKPLFVCFVGLQAAELNTNEDSTLYQYINTSSGSCYEWSIQHRGRCGTDTMALVIGPKQSYNPTKASRTSRDQFMQMVDWLKNNEDESTSEKIKNQQSGDKPIECVVYSKKFASNGTFENASDRNFSLSQTDVFSEEWHIWIIKSDNREWHKYGKGSKTAESSDYYKYIVPEGSNQYLLLFHIREQMRRDSQHPIGIILLVICLTVLHSIYITLQKQL